MTTSKKVITNKAKANVVSPTTKGNSKNSENGKGVKIAELLNKLKAATLRSEKQQIRRQLRVLGHRGGLHLKPGAKVKSK